MEFYIETENNLAKNHPAFKENLIAAFGEVPENWVPFNRVDPPKLDMYEVCETVYELIGDVYTDVHHVRKMTPEEIEQANKLFDPFNRVI